MPKLHTHQLLQLHGMQLISDQIDDEINDIFKDMIEDHHKTALTMNATSHQVKELMKDMMKKAHEVEMIQPQIHYHAITWGTGLLIAAIIVIGIVYWVRRRPRETVDVQVKYAAIEEGGKEKVLGLYRKFVDKNGQTVMEEIK
jgi:hypothetical protein